MWDVLETTASELKARRKPQCIAVLLSGSNTPGEEKWIRATVGVSQVFEL